MNQKKNTRTPTKAKTTPAKKAPKKAKVVTETQVTEVISDGKETIVATATIQEVEEVEVEETSEETASQAEETLTPSPQDKGLPEAQALWSEAQAFFHSGNYKAARKAIVSLLTEQRPTHEMREQANELLSRMEMDLRTLMIGAVGMLTLLLIPTLGIARALWTLPILFLILLLDPRLFRSPESAD